MKTECSVKIAPDRLIIKIDGEYTPVPPCDEVEVVHSQEYQESPDAVGVINVNPIPVTFSVEVKIDGKLWLRTHRCVISTEHGFYKQVMQNFLTLSCDSDRTERYSAN